MTEKKEYIEREKAITVIIQNGADAGAVRDMMEIPAADMVEVVRCRDCRYFKCAANINARGQIWCDLKFTYMPCDAFCSYGEKRGEDHG